MTMIERMAEYQRRTGLRAVGPHRPLTDKLQAEGKSRTAVRAIVLLQYPGARAEVK